LNPFKEKMDNDLIRRYYPLIFAIPLNIILMGNSSGIGIQWPLFRFEITPAEIGFFPITNSFLFAGPGHSVLSQYFLFFGVLSLVVSYVLLYYRVMKSAKETGLLTLLGAILIICSSMMEYGILLSGPAGISIPAGVLLILVLGILMYRSSPQEPEIPPLKKRKIRRELSGGDGRKPQEITVTTTDPAGTPMIGPEYYVSLILLNFVTNYIFLSYYGFVSDDWSTMSPVNEYSDIPALQLFFEPQRPFTYLIFKSLPLIFGNNQVLFFLLSFVLSSVLLIMVFLVVHSLLNQIKKCPPSYSYLVSVLYCILYNKGELYAFGSTMPNTVASVLYFVSFYYFINSEKKPYYVYISLVCFTLALFTYELGIFFPVLYLIYVFSYKKPVKNVLMFIAPVVFFAIIRITNWFGFGLVLSKASVISLSELTSSSSTSQIVSYFTDNLIVQIPFFLKSITFGNVGLKGLPFTTLVLLLLLDWIIAVLVVWILIKDLPEEKFDIPFQRKIPLILMGITGIFVPFVLVSLHGLMATRYMGFIDIFACFIGILVVMKYLKKTAIVIIPLFLLVVFCLMINQGLFFNYVVSHNVQHNMDEAIVDNMENIVRHEAVFINVSDLRYVGGNYWNANGLHSWSIKSMIQNAGVDPSTIKLIYWAEGEDPESFLHLNETKSFFEFNRTNVNMENIRSL